MISKNYILVTSEKVEGKYTINRYYFVMDGKKFKIEGNHLKILRPILNSYEYISRPNNSKIFIQFDEITNEFTEVRNREKLNQVKRKKVNRIKSKSIRVVTLGLSIFLLGNLAISFGSKKNTKVSSKSNDTTITSTVNNSNNDSNEKARFIITDEEIDTTLENTTEYYNEPTTSVEIDTNTTDSYDNANTDNINGNDINDNTNNEKEDDTLIFEYESDVPIYDESLENALRYKDLFIKYGNQYGVPWQLLCAIAAQESGGVHYVDYNEPALGIMQVERDALIGHTFKNVYNYNTNSIESFTVRNDTGQLEDLEYNIKVGAIELQDCIRVTFNVGVKQNKISLKELLAYLIQRYNFGAGNMIMILNMEGNWMDNRVYIDAGDSEYFERILGYLDKLGINTLVIECYDEELYHICEVTTKFVNTYNNKLRR